MLARWMRCHTCRYVQIRRWRLGRFTVPCSCQPIHNFGAKRESLLASMAELPAELREN